jgi:hypothetical protein
LPFNELTFLCEKFPTNFHVSMDSHFLVGLDIV